MPHAGASRHEKETRRHSIHTCPYTMPRAFQYHRPHRCRLQRSVRVCPLSDQGHRQRAQATEWLSEGSSLSVHILCRFFMASFFLPIDFYIPCSDFDRTKTQYVPRHVSMRDLQSIAFCNRPCIMHLKGEYPGYFVNTASFCVTSLRFPTHAITMPN